LNSLTSLLGILVSEGFSNFIRELLNCTTP
jgi:hypothetical protein